MGNGNETSRPNRLLDPMDKLSGEMHLKLTQEMDSMMNMIYMQINRAISSAINDKVIPEIQNKVDSFSLRERDFETGTDWEYRPWAGWVKQKLITEGL